MRGLTFLLAFLWTTKAFQFSKPIGCQERQSTSTTALSLIPLAKFRNELNFFSSDEETRCCLNPHGKFELKGAKDEEEPFELYIVEENDLPEVSLFIIKSFGADAISLSSGEFNALEKRLLEPAMDFFNGYVAVNAFAEVLWGLRLRQSDRILNDSINDISGPEIVHLPSAQEKIAACNRKSLVLVAARPSSNTANNSSKWTSLESNIDVIASVELRLQVSTY
jgi:hypothetical protein